MLGESVQGKLDLGDMYQVKVYKANLNQANMYQVKVSKANLYWAKCYFYSIPDSKSMIFTYLVKSSGSAIVDEYEGLDAYEEEEAQDGVEQELEEQEEWEEMVEG